MAVCVEVVDVHRIVVDFDISWNARRVDTHSRERRGRKSTKCHSKKEGKRHKAIHIY